MKDKIVLVMDCGATNVRTIAVSERGALLASQSMPNNTRPDPQFAGGVIWDVQEIWNKLVTCTASVIKQIDPSLIAGVTVTTFGVDGAPMDRNGNILYPVISWQCSRTAPIMENINKYIAPDKLFELNGLQPFSFNTINKLIWFKENRPDIIDKMDRFVFIPSIFLYFLCGEIVNDTTMAGTSMLTDIGRRTFSDTIFSAIGIDSRKMARLIEPGTVAGRISAAASAKTGIPEGIPVIATGHDTQFAIFGSGADENIPVLSTGTWEILMVRSRKYSTAPAILKQNITTEWDPVPGLYNMGVQWIGSGLVEWVKKTFYPAEAGSPTIYDIMINEGEQVPAGSHGVTINPYFFAEQGTRSEGAIEGLTLNSTRADIYRACLETLSRKVKSNLAILEQAGGFKAQSLIVVGGGSKNRLWNNIRAGILGIPLTLIDQKETTVLGAALFAFSGAGVYSSPDEARNQINYLPQPVEPILKNEYEHLN